MAPRKAYFEFAAQPARMMPYTPIEVSASTYSSPASMFANTLSGDSGITAQMASAGIKREERRRAEQELFASAGMMISLNSSLNTSANGCASPGKSPKKATRFGPLRNCIQPMTLRSRSTASLR
jgi:hypothetical protein